jgi:hypothetical protein
VLGFIASSKRWQIGHVYVFACPPVAGRMSHQRTEPVIEEELSVAIPGPPRTAPLRATPGTSDNRRPTRPPVVPSPTEPTPASSGRKGLGHHVRGFEGRIYRSSAACLGWCGPCPRRGVVHTRPSLWVGPIELRLRLPHVPRVLLDRKTRSWKTTTTSSLELKLQYLQPSCRSALLSALAARVSFFSALALNVDLGGF